MLRIMHYAWEYQMREGTGNSRRGTMPLNFVFSIPPGWARKAEHRLGNQNTEGRPHHLASVCAPSHQPGLLLGEQALHRWSVPEPSEITVTIFLESLLSLPGSPDPK